jgi:hypothetical protein
MNLNGIKVNIVFLTIVCLLLSHNNLFARDVSLEVAQDAKQKVDRAADSLKDGLQKFGEKINAVGPELYKTKAQIDQYKKAGQWENLSKGEKALLLVNSLEAAGSLELAFSENLDEILEGMEEYEMVIGDAVIATSVVKSANADASYFFENRKSQIRESIPKIQANPSLVKAKETLKSTGCKDKSNPECLNATQTMLDYKLKIRSYTQELHLLKQQAKLAENNKKLANTIQGRLRREGPYASNLFRQVIDTWVQLSRSMELLRSIPESSILGNESEDKTRNIITLADNMIKMGNDLIFIVNTVVDQTVDNFSDISGISVSGGIMLPGDILESTNAAEKNLTRLLSE